MSTVAIAPKNKLHPHKFTLWVGIGSILMMFAGLTSAYVVKRNQANWTTFEWPMMFWYSTAVIILSSGALYLALKAFKERSMARYRKLMVATLVLGLLFIFFQVLGFTQLWNAGLTLQSNVAYSFLYVIVGLHALHVIGGLITLIAMAFKAFSMKVRNYSSLPVELISTYWHFVGVLWLYLLAFLLMIR
ncbi:MAG: cytochrome c oxidase subunit 3 [Gloeobacteraceae cyanobacterium ES-bin-316]|nr:cytochrome c oxidase subunit 3 [Ferruginibacter sp.]